MRLSAALQVNRRKRRHLTIRSSTTLPARYPLCNAYIYGNDDHRADAAGRRTESFLVTLVSVGELAVLFDTSQQARLFLQRYRQLRLFPEIAYAATPETIGVMSCHLSFGQLVLGRG